MNKIDFSSKAERKACEKKWDILQAIWTIYKSGSNSDEIKVPIKNLAIKGRIYSEVEIILEGLEKDGCFNEWWRGKPNYAIRDINHKRLSEVYWETKTNYEKFIKGLEIKFNKK